MFRNDIQSDVEFVAHEIHESRARAQEIHDHGGVVDKFDGFNVSLNLSASADPVVVQQVVQREVNVGRAERHTVTPCDALTCVDGELREIVVVLPRLRQPRILGIVER